MSGQIDSRSNVVEKDNVCRHLNEFLKKGKHVNINTTKIPTYIYKSCGTVILNSFT